MGIQDDIVATYSEDKMFCYEDPPSAKDFRENMIEDWGKGYTIVYFLYPAVICLYSFILFGYSFAQIKKCLSIAVRNSCFWILGLFPIFMLCHMLALYIPAMIPYLEFIQTIWLAYALHRAFLLFQDLVGGPRVYEEKTDCLKARGNQPPLCCFFCLCPVFVNSERTKKFISISIYQFCFVTFTLMSDFYEIFSAFIFDFF